MPGNTHMFLHPFVLIVTSHDLCQLWLKTTNVAWLQHECCRKIESHLDCSAVVSCDPSFNMACRVASAPRAWPRVQAPNLQVTAWRGHTTSFRFLLFYYFWCLLIHCKDSRFWWLYCFHRPIDCNCFWFIPKIFLFLTRHLPLRI